MTPLVLIIAALLIVIVAMLLFNIRVLREYERGVCFRVGRLRPLAGPGLVFLRPFIDRLVRVDLRTVTLTIPPGGHHPRQCAGARQRRRLLPSRQA